MTDANSAQLFSDSKLAGCLIRGLPCSALDQAMNNKQFKYINCLDREYSTNFYDITSVQFDISRYGKYTHKITFPQSVCEKEAIEKVEEYLSEPLTEEYYNNIVNDLFHEAPWEEAKDLFNCRGQCLTDCKFLEDVEIDNGMLTFSMGS